MNLQTLGGRRFMLSVGVGVVASALQYLGKLDPAGNSYMLIILGTVASYITGNTFQKIKE